jgi:hypothetical protein
MTDTHIAKLMWNAYAIQAGGKTFDGKPLPTWDELGDERQSCWIAAASVTASRIEKLEAALREIAWIATPDHEEARHKATEIARKALDAK